MKKGMILMLFVALLTTVSASNQTAIDYFKSGDLKKAKSLFLATSNLDATDYYYLGKIQLLEKNTSAAAESFNKGLQMEPNNLYNRLGLASIELASNPKEAQKTIKAISGNKAYKKDVAMQVAIAEVFARNDMQAQYQSYLAKAKKIDKKSALPYILEGNLLMEKGNSNEAAVRFENAVYFDPNAKIALVKLAQLYVGTRRQIAFDYLDRATTVDPNYEYGWKTQADIRYQNGFYPEAKATFEKYMALITPQPEDYQKYGEILYFNKDFSNSLNALAKAPVNTVTNRLKFYNMYDQNKLQEALPYAETLFNTTPKNELIWQDYNYYANILNKEKDYLNAAKYYELAYLVDSTRTGSIAEIAKTFEKGKDYPNAIKYYEKIITSSPEYTLADVYNLGVAYTNAGTDVVAVPDSLQREEYLIKASETFGRMIELSPEEYLGYLLQARANSALDPQTTAGLAKPYYERLLTIVEKTPDERKKEIQEAYEYLEVYYFKQDQYAQSREYAVKVLELDPENALAKQVIRSIDSIKK